MRSLVFVAVMVFVSISNAQRNEFDESESSAGADSFSTELPLPLPEAQPAPTSRSTVTKIILTSRSGENIETARNLTRLGAGLYFTGLGLEYAVAVPLAIAGAVNMEEGPIIGGAIVEFIATGFRISGAIRSGIGASMAYDAANGRGLYPERNNNWGFYKAGWAFYTVGSVLSQIGNLGMQGGMEEGSIRTISTLSLTCAVTADVLWTVSVVNSLKYTQNISEKLSGRSALSIYPVYSSAHKSFGAVANYSF